MINDLPDVLQDSESSLFADDSCLFKSGRNLSHITKSIQNNLDRISTWCDTWVFKISLDNTVVVVFSRRTNTHRDLTINNHLIKIDNRAKFLGLQDKLEWAYKIPRRKCKKRLNLLRAVAGNTWGANEKSLLTI